MSSFQLALNVKDRIMSISIISLDQNFNDVDIIWYLNLRSYFSHVATGGGGVDGTQSGDRKVNFFILSVSQSCITKLNGKTNRKGQKTNITALETFALESQKQI